MSEQTPDTSNGLTDGAEPSMEDILASIRKIIADDEDKGNVSDNVPAFGELDDVQVPEINEALDSAVSDKGTQALNETLDLDITADKTASESLTGTTEEDIDLLIADIDMRATDEIDADLSNLVETEDTLDAAIDESIGLEIPTMDESTDIDTEMQALVDEIAADTREVGPLEAETASADVQADQAIEASLEESSLDLSDTREDVDDDLSAMLDDMMGDTPDAAEAEISENLELVIDPAEDLLQQDDDLGLDEMLDDDLESETINTESDMDLVKSLMADLTGAPLHDELDVTDEAAETDAVYTAEDIQADLLTENLVTEEVETEVTSDEVMDEILSLTLDDEMDIQDQELEASAIAEPLSLKDIAAQAEAEADAIDSGPAKELAAASALVAAATLASGKDDTQALDIDDETAKTDDVDTILSQLDEIVEEPLETEATPDLTPDPMTDDLISDKETTPMPRAVKKDAIIDDVTESATAGAFASLNQVVEDKALVAERGDRIGDLVQEALRPMLKEWLEANLKGIVERAVTKEVKRISSGK